MKDPRRKQGHRDSLISILLLARAAILSTHVSELARAQGGATQREAVKKALGFQKGVTPPQTTIHRLFRRLNAEEIAAAFRRIFLPIFEQDKQERGACAAAMDGKAQRGRLKVEQEEAYPIHAVSLVEPQTGIVLPQGHVEQTDHATSNGLADPQLPRNQKSKPHKSKPQEDQEKDEQQDKKEKRDPRAGFPPLEAHRLERQSGNWRGLGRLTRCWCPAICSAKGDYLFRVQANQRQLFEDLRLLCAPREPAKGAGEGILRLPEHHAQTAETGHGRMDIRRMRVSCELKGYSDWPG